MQIPFLQLEDRRFYVYAHVRKDTGNIFYIGKGKGYRSTVASPFHRNGHWIRIVKKATGFHVIYIHNHLTEKEAFELEVDAIRKFRENGIALCNMTDGGDGVSGIVRTGEWKRKIGNAHKGKTISSEVRRKISQSLKSCGYVPSEETRKKISEANKGKKRALGYRHTEEWKSRSMAWKTGNKSRIGQIQSAEEREKHSMALRGRPQNKKTCPCCGKTGGNAMVRWHFDNCKLRVA